MALTEVDLGSVLGPQGAPGKVQSVNGKSEANIVLGASDIGINRYTVSVPVSAWRSGTWQDSQSTSWAYKADITVSGMTADQNGIGPYTLSNPSTQNLADFGLLGGIDTAAGKITVYATAKPSADMVLAFCTIKEG